MFRRQVLAVILALLGILAVSANLPPALAELVQGAEEGSSGWMLRGEVREGPVYGLNDTDVAIPDYQGNGVPGYAQSTIVITSAPDGAAVVEVEYRLWIAHTWPGDLVLSLANGDDTEIIWDRLGGTDDGGYDDDTDYDDDIYLNHRLSDGSFQGNSVNGEWQLRAEDWESPDVGTISYVEVWIFWESAVSVDVLAPASLLGQNYPNPFNPSTRIPLALVTPCDVSLAIFDSRGRHVATLLDGIGLQAGHHECEWNGRDASDRSVSAGVYIYRILAGGVAESRKLTLLE